MAERFTRNPYRAVLIVDADLTHRLLLEEACRVAGVPVRGISSIAELERWPRGRIVITDRTHLAFRWKDMGAVEVIALVQNTVQAVIALQNGATRCLSVQTPVPVIAAMVRVWAQTTA